MKLYTIESIHQRCVEDGDCWEWQSCTTATGHPTVRHDGKTVLVRRIVISLSGRQIGPKDKAVTTCENTKCVNPDHVVTRTHRQVMKRQGELGKLSDPTRIAKIAATKRAGHQAKLTMEDARAIRSSSDTHKKIAEQYSIHPSKVASIRQHRCWRELTGNPFAGLGAR